MLRCIGVDVLSNDLVSHIGYYDYMVMADWHGMNCFFFGSGRGIHERKWPPSLLYTRRICPSFPPYTENMLPATCCILTYVNRNSSSWYRSDLRPCRTSLDSKNHISMSCPMPSSLVFLNPSSFSSFSSLRRSSTSSRISPRSGGIIWL